MVVAKKRTRSRRARSRPKKKEKKYGAPVVRIGPAPFGIRSLLGTRKRLQLNYSEQGLSLTSGALSGLASTYVFRANSLYDPNFTGIGHQPMGLDQIFPLYEKAIVLKAKVKLNIINTSSADSALVGYQVNDNAVGGGAQPMMAIIENGQCEWQHLMPTSAGGTNTGYFYFEIDMPSAMGQTYTEYMGDDTNYHTSSTNPTDTMWLTVWAGNGISGTSPQCNFHINIVFDVMFIGSAQLAQS